jgi:hypothetical protein
MSVSENVKFGVCTNDVSHAKAILPDALVKIVSGYLKSKIYSGPDRRVDEKVEVDLPYLQNAKYLILANSSFSCSGAWTNQKAKLVVSSKYWARYKSNGPFWSTGGSLTRDWTYVDTTRKAYAFYECSEELKHERYNG